MSHNTEVQCCYGFGGEGCRKSCAPGEAVAQSEEYGNRGWLCAECFEDAQSNVRSMQANLRQHELECSPNFKIGYAQVKMRDWINRINAVLRDTHLYLTRNEIEQLIHVSNDMQQTLEQMKKS